MAVMNDPETIRFVNERLRPLAEKLHALDVEMQDTNAAYVLLQANLGNAEDSVEDGREAQGVSRLTVGDLQNFISQVRAIVSVFDGTGVRDVIRKPTVRKLKIGG